MLGVCVMVKSVSEMSDRKVSKSKCCRPPSSSSSFPSSMGTTLQKSWLHHFSVGLQASSSWVRWRWVLVGTSCRQGPCLPPWLLPRQFPDNCSLPHPRASSLAHWCFWRVNQHPSSLPSSGHHRHAFPELPGTGLHIMPLSPLPILPQKTHLLWAGELSLPAGLSELEGEEGDSWGVGRSRAGQRGQWVLPLSHFLPASRTTRTACSRVWPWPPPLHICLYCTGQQ